LNNGHSSVDLEHLLTHLKDTRGFDFTAYKRTTLARRIEKRMAEVGVDSYTAYRDHLEVYPEEFTHLFNGILINVTSFFRDAEAFDHLRTIVIPKVVENSNGGDIRVWSAGCASGEEAYSVAVLFAETLGREGFRNRVKIYATDVDDEELTTARAASYSDGDTDGLSADLRERYFEHLSGQWIFAKDLRRCVIFGRHDLLSDAPISRVDLLLCRNTLMYFHREAQGRIVERFHYALRDGGFLVLGKAEMLVNFATMFSPLDPKQRVFVKLRGEPGTEQMLTGHADRIDRTAPAAAPAARLREVSFDQDPTAQFVVDPKGHLLMINARARELFGLTPRDVGRPLQDLEVSYRPVDLRSCIDEAHTRHQIVMLREVAWPTAAGDVRHFNVQVTPILDAADSALGSKIIFLDVTRQRELQDALQHSRQELETAYEELQSTNEELETTNEELQSTVEELETTNEELQSTNEELETMNEELQSTNEELETVNGELRQRGVDLSRSNVFLSGILRSVPLAVIVLDDQLQVELWNDVAADLWGLRADEVYRRHFFGLDIGLPVEQLKQPLAGLLRHGDQRFEVQVNAINRRGRQIQLRVQCVGIGSAEHGKGIIILMQESSRTGAVH
jgi:two-component system, chemotaxis family, CheB/CheR fusion protein